MKFVVCYVNFKIKPQKLYLVKNAKIISVLCLSFFAAGVDINVISISLPTIGKHFGASPTDISAVMWVYFLVLTVLLMPVGKLGDFFGFKKIFVFGGVIFLTGSLLCTLATSVNTLVVFRIFQGIGASVIFTTVPAVISGYLPEKIKGKIFGFTYVSVAMGGVFGRILSGFVIENFGWKALFLTSTPVILSMFVVLFRKPGFGGENNVRKKLLDFSPEFSFEGNNNGAVIEKQNMIGLGKQVFDALIIFIVLLSTLLLINKVSSNLNSSIKWLFCYLGVLLLCYIVALMYRICRKRKQLKEDKTKVRLKLQRALPESKKLSSKHSLNLQTGQKKTTELKSGISEKITSRYFDFKIFRDKKLLLSVISFFLLYIITNGAIFTFPFYLSYQQKIDLIDVGLIMAIPSLFQVVFGLISGFISDKKKEYSFVICLIGYVMILLSFMSFVMFKSMLLTVIFLMVYGAGIGSFVPSNTKIVMSHSSASNRGIISGMMNTVNRLGSSFGVFLFGVLMIFLGDRHNAVDFQIEGSQLLEFSVTDLGFSGIFIFGVIITFVGLVLQVIINVTKTIEN